MRDKCPQRKRHCWCKRVSGVGPLLPLGGKAALGFPWLSSLRWRSVPGPQDNERSRGFSTDHCTEVTPANTFPSAILLKVSLCSSSRL